MKNKDINQKFLNELVENRCLIVTDLDGTLLRNDLTISKKSLNIIKKIIAKGHVFCIATGRPLRAAIDYYHKLELKTIMANFNGSFISNPSDNSYAPINLAFSNDLAIKVLKNELLMNWIDNIFIENSDGTLLMKIPKNPKQKREIYEYLHINNSSNVQKINKNLSNVIGDIHSILILVKDKSRINDIVYQIKSITNTLIVRSWSISTNGAIIIEINSIFSSKGMFLKFLSSYYGIPLDRCFAFGDGDNDAEMLKTAYFGYAMHNGSTTAKLLARHMTEKTNDDDGEARELEKIFLH